MFLVQDGAHAGGFAVARRAAAAFVAQALVRPRFAARVCLCVCAEEERTRYSILVVSSLKLCCAVCALNSSLPTAPRPHAQRVCGLRHIVPTQSPPSSSSSRSGTAKTSKRGTARASSVVVMYYCHRVCTYVEHTRTHARTG